MSTKPATEPQWDTGNVHVTATTAGHKSSGYASNEIPASDEINYWFNLVYLWIHWLAAQLDDVVEIQVPITTSSNTTGFVATAASLSGPQTLYIHQIAGLRVGDTIVGFKVRGKGNDSPTTTTWNASIFSITDGTVSGSLGSSTGQLNDNAARTSAASGLAITVASLTDYGISVTQASGTLAVYTASVLVQRQAA